MHIQIAGTTVAVGRYRSYSQLRSHSSEDVRGAGHNASKIFSRSFPCTSLHLMDCRETIPDFRQIFLDFRHVSLDLLLNLDNNREHPFAGRMLRTQPYPSHPSRIVGTVQSDHSHA